MNNISSKFKMFHKGQSLVETALILPLVLIMVIGVVEIGQYLVTTNRIRTVANTSARFAANGGQNDGIPVVALNTVTQTLPFNTQYWDMWAIRGQVNEQGTGFETWEFTHVYGDQITQEFGEVNEGDIQLEVLNDLKTQVGGSADDGVQAAKGVEFAGTLVLYDAQSILGLEYFLGDLFTVQALNVMRTYPVNPTTNGCTAFPIAVKEASRTISRLDYDGLNRNNPTYPSDDDFPSFDDFPSTPEGTEDDRPRTIAQGLPGDLYLIYDGTGSGDFGWLRWNRGVTGAANNLNAIFSWPGLSDDYSDNGAQGQPVAGSGFPHTVYGFIDYDDPTDTEMHIGDRIMADTGLSANTNIRNTLQGHIDLGRSLRLLVWEGAENQGNNVVYTIKRFVVMRLHAYRLQNPHWILAELVSHDTSCGQVNQ